MNPGICGYTGIRHCTCIECTRDDEPVVVEDITNEFDLSDIEREVLENAPTAPRPVINPDLVDDHHEPDTN